MFRDYLILLKRALPQITPVIAGTLIGINGGMQFSWTSPIIPKLIGPDSPVKTNRQEAEWLETILMTGSFCTLGLTMYLVDKIGRKKSLLVACFIALFAWTVIALAPSMKYIFFARAFAGSADNMCFISAPMYISEISDRKIRGFLSSMIYLMMMIGTILIYSVGPFVPIYVHCLIGATIVSIQLVIFPFMPESPYYYFYKDNPDEARRSLERLRPPGSNIEEELCQIKYTVERQRVEKGNVKDLFMVPSNRKAIIIMMILNMAQHFSGISALTMNMHSILNAAGSVYLTSSTAAMVFAVIMFFALLIAACSIDKYGRKRLLIISCCLCGLCQISLAVYFTLKSFNFNTDSISWIPIASVMFYACSFKLGLGTIPIVLTAELFNTRMKAIGMTFADGIYVVGCIITLQLYQIVTNNFGIQYLFYIFFICCYIAAAFTYFCIPETKGKSLHEIQLILKGEQKSEVNG